jgi:hypothetical protein
MKYIILILLVGAHSLFAVTSIEPIEIGHTKGIYGDALVSLETKKGNTNKENYKASVFVADDNNVSYVTWGRIAAEYGETNDKEDTNKVYLHIRHIHALTKKSIRYELYGQIEEDEFKRIKNRTLLGAGLRYKVLQIFQDGKGYIGLGAFGESIQYTTLLDPDELNMRLSSYLAYSMKLGDDSRLAYTFYYQPKINKISDYVMSHKFELQMHVYRELFLSFKLAYDLDSSPAIGVSDYDYTQTTSFVYKF